MTKRKTKSPYVCSICRQKRKIEEVVLRRGYCCCIYCRDVLEEWAEHVQMHFKELEKILEGMHALEVTPQKEKHKA